VSAFVWRGVVEGFYGKPWAHEDRLWLLERMGRWGMNVYFYAPKDDPLHLARWREPYPDAQMREFAELVAAGERAGVAIGMAVSPGRSITYSDPADRAAFVAKLASFHALGLRLLSIALDDVPTRLQNDADRAAFKSFAAAQIALVEHVQRALPRDAVLWLGPTEYLGTDDTEYLDELGRGLPPEIEVSWTGRTVLSPTIPAAEAAARAKTLRRKLVLWDNTPVADGPMRPMLHLNPYTGRDRELPAHVSGVLLNPMEQVRASAITLRAATEYLAEPRGYDAEAAWRRAVDELGGPLAPELARFAAAHRFSPLTPDERDRELEAALATLKDAVERARGVPEALAAAEGLLAARLEANGALRERLADRRLADELEPWLASHAVETRCMQAALGGLRALETGETASARALGFTVMQGKLTRETPTAKASYGPRRVLYPQFTSMHDDAMGFGRDPALVTDRCLADEWIRFVEARASRVLAARR
jgi:hyaluronoglucosaminidase